MKIIDRKKINGIAGCLAFISLIICIFFKVTYLFRPVSENRERIVGLKQENVDIVYIGGSAAFQYWLPDKVWGDCGYTSYSYATNTIQAESLKAYIQEARRTQNPELFIVGIRAFQYYTDDNRYEFGLRNGTDSMDLTSINRYKLLNDYWSHKEITEETDVLSSYVDIIKYHTNTENLGLSSAWEYIHNNKKCASKGWEWNDEYTCLDKPEDYYTEDTPELTANREKILSELLEFCRSENLNVLFVVCPYYIIEEDYAMLNTISEKIKEYGFGYLNANDYYEEIGIDWSTDFMDKNHVNLLGAEKYTEFLEKYISDNYSITDHRGDNGYKEWDKDYDMFVENEKIHRETIMDLKLDWKKRQKVLEQMQNAQSLSEWERIARDNRYNIFIAGAGNINWPSNTDDQEVLLNWQIKKDSYDYIRMITGSMVGYSNEYEDETTISGKTGIYGNVDYNVSIGESSVITVGKVDYTVEDDSMNVVVFDNIRREVVGHLMLNTDEEGNIQISYLSE